MATRREKVILELEDNFTSDMARAAAATRLLASSLDDLNRHSHSSSSSSNIVVNNMNNQSRAADRNSRSINQLTGRLRLMVDAFTVLGPALIPIGAVAIPAVTGLAAAALAAGLAGGVMVTAFQGVGAVLTAMNAYQLAPTAANLQKVRATMDNLSPAAQNMAIKLHDVQESLKTLRDASAQELFPGLIASIDEMMTRGPEVEQIFRNIAEVTGSLAAEGGAQIAGPGFDKFFDYLKNDVPETLINVGRTIGNLVDGTAQLLMAFDPLNDDFNSWILNVSRYFNEWATGLDQTQGFQEFVAYVRQTAPEVGDALGSIADAILQIVEAASPIGGAVLQGVTLFANAIASIADTPFGSVLVAWAGASVLFSRSMGMVDSVMRKFGVNVAASGGSLGVMRGAANATRTSMGTLARDVGVVSTTMMTAGTNSQRGAARFNESATRLRAMGSAAGKTAGIVGALAIVTSGAGDAMGLQNTAMMGLMGTMAGPYGAAIGATIGLTMDAAGANNDFADSLERAQLTLQHSPTDFAAQNTAIADMTKQYEDFKNRVDPSSVFGAVKSGFDPAYWKNLTEGMFGSSDLQEMQQAGQDFVKTQQDMQRAYSNLANEVQGNFYTVDYTKNLGDLQNKAEHLQPALDAVGITIQQLAKMPVGSDEWHNAVGQIEDYLHSQDSVQGRTRSLVDALGSVDDQLVSTADSADQLSTALQNLLGPGLDAEAATDKWRTSLKALRTELKDVPRAFSAFTEAGRANRETTRQAVVDTEAMLSARAAAGASTQQLARLLQQSRQGFIQEGVAAGVSRDAMIRRANAIGLTPKLVTTVFKALGLTPITQDAMNLAKRLNALPKELRVRLSQKGFPEGQAQVEALTKKYNLTPKEVRTILEARDNASVKIDKVTGKAKAVPQSVSTDLNAQDNASGKIGAVAGALVGLNGKRADTYIYTHHIDTVTRTVQNVIGSVFGGKSGADGMVLDRRDPNTLVKTFADGGVMPAIGDQQPQVRSFSDPKGVLWSEAGSGPWEAFISGAPQKADRSRAIADDVVGRLGGEVAWKAADGALFERKMRMSSMPTPHIVVAPGSGDMKISGTLETPFGPAQVRGIVRQEISDDQKTRDRRVRAGMRT